MALIFIGSTDVLSAEHTSRFLVPFLRWFDPNDSGNDHGLSIDDLSVSFTVTPVPEPREYAAVAALGLLGFAAYRRRSLSRV